MERMHVNHTWLPTMNFTLPATKFMGKHVQCSMYADRHINTIALTMTAYKILELLQ